MFTDTNPAMQLAAAFSWFSSPQAHTLYRQIAKYSKLTLIGIAQYSLVIAALTIMLTVFLVKEARAAYVKYTDQLMAFCSQPSAISENETHNAVALGLVEFISSIQSKHSSNSSISASLRSSETENHSQSHESQSGDVYVHNESLWTSPLAIANQSSVVSDQSSATDSRQPTADSPLTYRELKAIAKAHKVPKYSRLNKSELLELLASLDLISHQ